VLATFALTGAGVLSAGTLLPLHRRGLRPGLGDLLLHVAELVFQPRDFRLGVHSRHVLVDHGGLAAPA